MVLLPRKYRWSIAPNDGMTIKELEVEWFSYFNLTEKRLPELLIFRKENKLKLLVTNINAIKAKIADQLIEE